MNFQAILNQIPNLTNQIKDKLTQLEPAYSQGMLLGEDILETGMFLANEAKVIGSINFDSLIEALKTDPQNEYRQLVKGMSWDEMMEFQQNSIEEMQQSNSTRIKEAYLLRKMIDFPQRVQTIIKMFT